MAQITTFSKIKGTVLTFLLLVLITTIGAIGFVNSQGFKGRWSTLVEATLANSGFYTDIGAFHYSLTKGVVTQDLKIYYSDTPDKLFADFKQINVNFDGNLLTRGKISPQSIQINGGTAIIELQDEKQRSVTVTDISCNIDLSQGYNLIIDSCHAKVAGIPVDLTLRSIGLLQPKENGEKTPLEIPLVIKEILEYVADIGFHEATPPTAKVNLIHTMGKENGLEIDIDILAQKFHYQTLSFQSLETTLKYKNKMLNILNLTAEDDTGQLTLTGDYDTEQREANFDIDSTTNLPRILRNFSLKSFADKLASPLPPRVKGKLTVQGTELKNKQIKWDISTYGSLELDEFRLLGTTFQSLETDFSWNDGKLLLRGMKVRHREGNVSGKILIMDQYIRYQATSDLPPYLYKPFIEADGILADNIQQTKFSENSTIQVEVNGSMQRDQINNWEANGAVALGNISYNDVPLETASCAFVITPLEAQFKDLEATFSYTSYIPSSYAEEQPTNGQITAEKVAFNSQENTVSIDNLEGKAWPGPIINLFAPEIGSFIDNTALLTSPPAFTINGKIGLLESVDKTHLIAEINRPIDLYYNLLAKDIRFSDVDVLISLIGTKVYLGQLAGKALGGRLKGGIEIQNKIPKHPKGAYTGDLSFYGLSLEDIAQTFEFETKTPGALTGRMSFGGIPADPRSVYGEGFVGLDEADLFYIPIFGPLSPIMSSIQGHKKTSHERVKSVSASLNIKDGIMYTNDLISTTPSAQIDGHGKIDLVTQEMDLTIKPRTKGFLGLLTLPIKPLEKLLQFRGTGTIALPKWSVSPFEATPQYLKTQSPPQPAIIVE